MSGSGFRHCYNPIHHSPIAAPPPRPLEDLLCFSFAPPTFTEFDGLSVQHLTATLKSFVFQEAVWSSIFSKIVV